MAVTELTGHFGYKKVVDEICHLRWADLTEQDCIDVAWAYYFFSVQFRENLELARRMFPDDEKLASLQDGECDTDNLSPWPGVAQAGERMNHDEFMRRLLNLSTMPDETVIRFNESGHRYLDETRRAGDLTRVLSLASYEDGGLEAVFTAMLTSPGYAHPVIAAFRHFLSEHIRFDSDAEAGHGALIRHLSPDDRILPLWTALRDLLVEFAPRLSRLA